MAVRSFQTGVLSLAVSPPGLRPGQRFLGQLSLITLFKRVNFKAVDTPTAGEWQRQMDRPQRDRNKPLKSKSRKRFITCL